MTDRGSRGDASPEQAPSQGVDSKSFHSSSPAFGGRPACLEMLKNRSLFVGKPFWAHIFLSFSCSLVYLRTSKILFLVKFQDTVRLSFPN